MWGHEGVGRPQEPSGRPQEKLGQWEDVGNRGALGEVDVDVANWTAPLTCTRPLPQSCWSPTVGVAEAW